MALIPYSCRTAALKSGFALEGADSGVVAVQEPRLAGSSCGGAAENPGNAMKAAKINRAEHRIERIGLST